MIGRVLAYGVMFFVPIVNTRALTQEDYGYYKQFHLIFETLAPLLMLGFPMSLQYYLPRARTAREKSTYVTQTLTFLITGSIVAMALYTVLGHVLGAGMGLMIRSFYWRLCAFTGLMMVSHYMEWLFAAEKEFGKQSLFHMLFAVLQSLVVIVSAWYYRSVSGIIWVLTVFAAFRCIYSLAYTVRRYRPSFRLISLATIKEQLSFALPVGLFGIVLMLVSQTDKFIITRFMGREAFAVYVVGAFQIPMVNMISMSVRNVTFPLMAQHHEAGDFREIADIWRRTAVKTSILYFPLFAFLEATAPFVVTVLFTDNYAGATPIFMIYMLLLVQLATDSVAIIQVFKRTNYLLRVFTVAFVANLGLSVFLYRLVGREGVPLATIITLFTTNLVNIVFASRLCGVGFFRFVPLVPLASRFLIAVIPGGILWWGCRRFAIDSFWELALVGVVYFATYFAICRAAGFVTLSDIRSLFGRGQPVA